MPRRSALVTLPVAVALSLAACSSGTVTNAPSPQTPTTAVSATPSVTPPPSTPSATASSTPSDTPTATSVSRTTDELKKALLALDDIPAGFQKEKSTTPEDSGVSVKGEGADCRSLADLIEAEKLEGSLASANVSFSGGDSGPTVDEAIDAMGTPAAAKAFITGFGDAVAGCRSLSLTIKGAGTSPLSVRKISFAKIGSGSVAVRFSAKSGPLEGFELIQVASFTGDVVVGMAFFGIDPTEAEQASDVAVAKAHKKLGISGTI